MITIRAAQMTLFSAERRRALVARLCGHVRQHFGAQTASLGEPALRVLVEDAASCAASYDLHTEKDCCRFVNLAVLYGWDFDQRPETAWMRDYLLDTGAGTPSQRLQRLVDACLQRRAQEAAWQHAQRAAGLAWDDEHDEDLRMEPKYPVDHTR